MNECVHPESKAKIFASENKNIWVVKKYDFLKMLILMIHSLFLQC